MPRLTMERGILILPSLMLNCWLMLLKTLCLAVVAAVVAVGMVIGASIGSVTGSISGNPVTVALNANETINDYEELYIHIEANEHQRPAGGVWSFQGVRCSHNHTGRWRTWYTIRRQRYG